MIKVIERETTRGVKHFPQITELSDIEQLAGYYHKDILQVLNTLLKMAPLPQKREKNKMVSLLKQTEKKLREEPGFDSSLEKILIG